MSTSPQQAPLTPDQIAQQEQKAAKHSYVVRLLIAVDDLGNVLTGGLLDETISSRAQRDAVQGQVLGKIISHCLDVLQPKHGYKAEAGDLERATAVAAVESTALDVTAK